MRKNTLITIVALIILCALSNPLNAGDVMDEILNYQKRLNNQYKDLRSMSNNLEKDEKVISIYICETVRSSHNILMHALNLLDIDSLVQNSTDRERIKPSITAGIQHVIKQIDICIDKLNLSIPGLTNQGIIATATRVRENLHEVKNLLQKVN